MFSGKWADPMYEREILSHALIDDWGRRVSAARARLRSDIHDNQLSPPTLEGAGWLEDLTLALEELQVAEEELHVQTEELSTSRALLEAEQARYRTLFEQAPVAYLVTDPQANITDANRVAVSLLGVDHDQLRGKPLAVFVSLPRRQAFRRRLNAFGQKDLEVGFRFRLRGRSGTKHNITASIGVVRDRRGIVTELRWLLADETASHRRERRVRSLNAELMARVEERTAELKRAMEAQEALARAAEAARRAAERASQEKSKLIAIVSHELRTPLAAMGGYAELLALGIRGPLNDAQRADLQRIQEAQSYILRLVDDLVGFSKLETGHLRFDIGDVIVRDALEALVSLVRPQAANKGIIVDLIRGESDAVVRADEERLRQIVLNLLANAIKFTPAQGHVRGTWSATGDTVLISIGDDGIGIPADKLELVFEPYVQLAVPRAARQTGSGLGLAISRDLARAMGGDLTASSSEEHGTVFTLRLPRSTRVPRSAPAGE